MLPLIQAILEQAGEKSLFPQLSATVYYIRPKPMAKYFVFVSSGNSMP
jgi:hypothetical protein